MICSNCGNNLPDGAKFCGACGNKLEQSAPVEQPVQQPVQQAAGMNTGYVPPVNQAAPVNQGFVPQQQSTAQNSGFTAPQSTQQPSFQAYNSPRPSAAAPVMGNANVMTVGDYIGTFILCGIPIVNLILLLVWAFGSGTNPNKKNYARAVLILGIIGGILGIIFSGVITAAIASFGF